MWETILLTSIMTLLVMWVILYISRPPPPAPQCRQFVAAGRPLPMQAVNPVEGATELGDLPSIDYLEGSAADTKTLNDKVTTPAPPVGEHPNMSPHGVAHLWLSEFSHPEQDARDRSFTSWSSESINSNFRRPYKFGCQNPQIPAKENSLVDRVPPF